MKAWGDPMSNQIVLDKVMQTLSEKFDYVVAAIEASKDLSTMKVEELQETLKAHEQWLLERDQQKENDRVLQAKVNFKKEGGKKHWKGKDKIKNHCKGRGKQNDSHNCNSDSDKGVEIHKKKGGKSVWKGKGKKKFDKSKVQCCNCGKCGHFPYECWSIKGSKVSEEVHIVEEEGSSSSEHVMLMATIEPDSEDNNWYVDTGCSNHMTRHKEWIVDLDSNIEINVRFANNSFVMAEDLVM
ncbi:uncharacterized protein LOC114175269 [Vigna unguiculata]|uniref:uncharacterized protein LOC114175269 n=1 Tax=Vigna unguiculata TaxID=3917 RepID=UPI00101622F9|nr:uncharacterized protein LOC114175269 [Vigna unguiculata]